MAMDDGDGLELVVHKNGVSLAANQDGIPLATIRIPPLVLPESLPSPSCSQPPATLPGAHAISTANGIRRNQDDLCLFPTDSGAHVALVDDDEDDEGDQETELVPNTPNDRAKKEKGNKQTPRNRLCLLLSLEAMCAQAIVIIVLIGFVLIPKSDHTQIIQYDNGLIPVDVKMNSPTGTPSPQGSSSLMEQLNLPNYTLKVIEFHPRSPQAKAFEWLSNNFNNSNNTGTQLPVWRLRQRFAVATFYNSLRGDHWVKNHGWLDWEMDECNWEQISIPSDLDPCDDSGHIRQVRFEGTNNLWGTLPPELALLDSLEVLSVILNFEVQGEIPSEIGLLTKLTDLFLGNMHLSGTLPTQVGRLQGLEQLTLGQLQIQGPLPSEIGKLQNLSSLIIGRTGVTGSIPSDIYQLLKLKSLAVFECPDLTVETLLPEAISNLPQLKDINLQSRTSGSMMPIPAGIGKLTELTSLGLVEWRINGTVPNEIAQLSKLEKLYLARNALVGTLPPALAPLTSLKSLDITFNTLEGKLEGNVFSRLTSLVIIQANDNQLSGTIPTEIGLLSNLQRLHLHNNIKLSGTLPTELLLLSKLTSLVVTNTSLSGTIPVNLCKILLPPQKMVCRGTDRSCYQVPTTNLSACFGTNLCGCDCGSSSSSSCGGVGW